jgi:hypothetical protein
VYEPLPPDGVDPFNAPGVLPEQIVCVPAIELPAITGLTVTCIAVEVSVAHAPDITFLRNHVVDVSEPEV